MDDEQRFEAEKQAAVAGLAKDGGLRELIQRFYIQQKPYKYTYNWSWMGRPVIQFPQDVLAMQELIWNVRPDLIVETGVARGGSVVFYASMLQLLGGDGLVVGVDVEIRKHNRDAIEGHPMSNRIRLIEGSSTSASVAEQVYGLTKGRSTVMVVLDSDHTHDHVRRELDLYAPLVTKGSYLVVFDTLIDDMPDDFYPDRRWGKGNNPKTAVHDFLKTTDRFVIDKAFENKLLITVAPDGYLKCIK
jgi:cephalosporin hydroxylase